MEEMINKAAPAKKSAKTAAPAKVEVMTAAPGAKKSVATAKPKAPAKPKTAAKKKTAPAAQSEVSHEAIAMLAHRYWTERGHAHGHDADDWFRAEQELLGKAS